VLHYFIISENNLCAEFSDLCLIKQINRVIIGNTAININIIILFNRSEIKRNES